MDERERMWRAAGDVKIDLVLLDELASELGGVLKDSAADCASPEEDDEPRPGYCLESRFQRVHHCARGRA